MNAPQPHRWGSSIARIVTFGVALVALGVLLSPPAFAASDIIPGHYIVVLEDSVDRPGDVARAQTEQRDGDLGFVYSAAIEGYSVSGLSKADVEALRNDPRVKSVMPDSRVAVAAQTSPTGIKRIFAPENPSLDIDEANDAPIDVDVAVLDTGVDYEHPDLDVVARTYCDEEAGKVKCTDNTGTDTNGHGTHVAGTVGAIDNGFGVVGVAPGARLWSVKVLDSTPSFADVLAGVNWVTEHADEIEVVNMSIGCEGGLPCSVSAVGEAISASAEEGVVYVAAAGNNAGNAGESTFGTNPDIITVSAIADYDGKAGGTGKPTKEEESTCASGADDSSYPFSNYGSAIEVAAPGVCILSTVPGGGYGKKTGTSMASPHVAGAAAILASRDNPEDWQDVEHIGDLIEEAGNLEWTDTSKDGEHEPLLDVNDGEFPVSAPLATTLSVLAVTKNFALLRGSIDPNGGATDYRFELGTTTSYGTNLPVPDVDSGLYKGEVDYEATGLKPGTTYHYRLVATNSAGTSNGEDKTFKTSADAPSVTTKAANGIATEQATLNGTVNPKGSETTYRFEYGKTTSYGTKIPIPDKAIGSGTSDVEVSQAISGLKAGTTYHFRVVATSAEGTSYGKDEAFVTKQGPAFSMSFGSQGLGDGQLNGPAGVATDSSGNVWVVDSGSNRIQKFNSKGEYLSKFGSFGTGNGQFNWPTNAAIDSSGNVWVVDSGSNRVQKFNSSGEYLSKFGSEGTGNGQFNEPTDVAIDSSGNVWVVDSGNTRVQKFNSSGEYLSKFGSEGTGNGQFGWPFGITIDPSGNLWVSDVNNHRVQKFNSSGTYLSKFGTKGTGNGQFNWPYGLEADPSGDIWVTDIGNDRVQKFNSSGEYQVQFGEAGSGPGQFGEAIGIASDPSGNLWVVDSSNSRVQKWVPARPTTTTKAASEVAYETATLNGTVNPLSHATEYRFEYGKTTAYGTKIPIPDKAIGSGTSDVEVSQALSGLKTGTTYHFRVVATSAEGTSYGKDEAFVTKQGPTFSMSFGSIGTGNGQLNGPYGVAADSSGNVWVVDSASNRIQKFNSKGEYLSKFGSFGSANGQFNWPTNVAIDSSGNLWVTDSGNHRIQKFNSKGEYLSKFGSFGSANGQFNEPTDVAIDSSGNVWVVDSANTRVQKFNSSGTYQSKFGSEGNGNGQFVLPFGIAIDSSGNVWVTDVENNRIQKFNSSGTYQSKFGSEGNGNSQFMRPYGLEADPSGNIWVTDSDNARVQKFNSSGEYQVQFGETGSGPGQFKEPIGIASDLSGDLWVVDTGNSRVQKWVP